MQNFTSMTSTNSYFPNGPLRRSFVVCGQDGAFFAMPPSYFSEHTAPSVGQLPMQCILEEDEKDDMDMRCNETLPPLAKWEDFIPPLSLPPTASTVKLPSILRRKRIVTHKSRVGWYFFFVVTSFVMSLSSNDSPEKRGMMMARAAAASCLRAGLARPCSV
jgi:hypothetical protein